jgi:hypothetical protein
VYVAHPSRAAPSALLRHGEFFVPPAASASRRPSPPPTQTSNPRKGERATPDKYDRPAGPGSASKAAPWRNATGHCCIERSAHRPAPPAYPEAMRGLQMSCYSGLGRNLASPAWRIAGTLFLRLKCNSAGSCAIRATVGVVVGHRADEPARLSHPLGASRHPHLERPANDR